MFEEFDDDSLLDEENDFLSDARRAEDVDNFLSEYREAHGFSEGRFSKDEERLDSEMDLVDLLASNSSF